MRLNFIEHFRYISACMDYDINAMAQIITKSLDKLMDYWVIFRVQYKLWPATWHDMISKNEILDIFNFFNFQLSSEKFSYENKSNWN